MIKHKKTPPETLKLFHCFVIEEKDRQKCVGWFYIPLGTVGFLRDSKNLLQLLGGAPSLWQALGIKQKKVDRFSVLTELAV